MSSHTWGYSKMELFHSGMRGRSDHFQPGVCPGSPQPVGMRQRWTSGHTGWPPCLVTAEQAPEILPLLQAPLSCHPLKCDFCSCTALPQTQLAGWGIFGKLGVPHEFLVHPPTVVHGHNTSLHPHLRTTAEGFGWLNQCSLYHFSIKHNHWRLLLMRSWPCVYTGGW